MSLLDYLPFDPTGPLKLPSKYKDRPLAPTPACKPERMADNFLAAWTDENGKPQRRVISKIEWLKIGGRNK